MNTKLIFILNNEGQGAAIKFPAAFPYPPSKTVVNPQSREETTYYKTDRTKKIAGQEAVVYTVAGFKLNLDDYSDGKIEETVPENSSAIEKGASIRLQELRDVLFDQIEYYKELKDAGEDVTDTLYERFGYLSKEDYVKIVEALL